MSDPKEDVQILHSVACTVVEAAVRNQELCSKAVSKLNDTADKIRQTTDSLPQLISQQVIHQIAISVQKASEETLTKQFKSATVEAEQAAKAYKTATEFATRHIGWKTTTITAAVVLGTICSVWFVTPSVNEIQTRRNEKAQLELEINSYKAEITTLRKAIRNSPITRCEITKGKSRLCARLDPNFPDSFGEEGAEYRIIQNK